MKNIHIFKETNNGEMEQNGVMIPLINGKGFVEEEIVETWLNHNLEVKTLVLSGTGKRITLVTAQLPNGFTIVESTTCVDDKNYSEKMGAEICKGKIKTKLWELLGFLLATANSIVD